MAIEEDESKEEKASKPPEEVEENWKETCIGIWSRSASGEKVNEDGKNRICNGISVVRIGQVSICDSIHAWFRKILVYKNFFVHLRKELAFWSLAFGSSCFIQAKDRIDLKTTAIFAIKNY